MKERKILRTLCKSGKIEYHEAKTGFILKDAKEYTYYPAYWSETALTPVHVRVECLNAFDKQGNYGEERIGDHAQDRSIRHVLDRDDAVTSRKEQRDSQKWESRF